MQSGGQLYLVPLGRLDSLEPAPLSAVDELPRPTFNVSQLVASFGSRGLDKEDLVALSGAHTIGKAHCASFADRFDADDSDFVRAMQHNCTASNGARKQDLDVATPTTFDDSYFGNLLAGKGVLTSDVQLLQDPRAMELVEGVATNEWWFWNQFDTSIRKLGLLQGPNGNVGEVRSISCSVRNHRSNDAA
jgi:peroxidase